MMRTLHFSFICCFLSFIFSSEMNASDTLYLDAYLDLVYKHHPLVKKAELNEVIRDAYDLKARGVLDPKLISDFETKSFQDKDYFSVWQSELKVPTSLPVDFSIGYERNNGLFLNPESNVPGNGLIYGTINVSLLRGFLFNEQRFLIQQAELNGIKSLIEQEIFIREILFQAMNTYLEWAQATNEYEINQEFVQLVQDRHQNVIQLFENGDKPAIDTLESQLNLNTANKKLLESKDSLIKVIQKLGLFVWSSEGSPLTVSADLRPMAIIKVIPRLYELALLLEPVFENDPYIRKFDNIIQGISLTNKLENENRKPKLDLKYNPLVDLGGESISPNFTLNDYKYGLAFQVPIFNRKTNGQIRLNEVQIEQNVLERNYYLEKMKAKYEALLSRKDNLSEQMQVAAVKVENSILLYNAELLKFDLGESSVFLLNSRERKLLEARIELLSTYGKLSEVLSNIFYLKLGQSL